MCKSYQKICKSCKSRETKKDWKRKWRQSYKCKDCNHIWITRSRKRKKIEIEKLYIDFSQHKQTYKELWIRYSLSIKTVQKRLDEYMPSELKEVPKKIILLIDTTYFWNFWLMIFKEKETRRVLNYKVVCYETNLAYKQGIKEIEDEWWEVLAIVCDWRKWLLWWFGNIPTQMCQFHQTQIIRRYITKKPILEANRDLNNLVKWLTRTDKKTFEWSLERRYRKYQYFIKERGISPKWKKYYIHRRTRSAYFSLKRNLKYLFVYQDYLWKFDIPNTTNGVESLFSHIKYKVNLHRWLRKDRKLKLITSLLNV